MKNIFFSIGAVLAAFGGHNITKSKAVGSHSFHFVPAVTSYPIPSTLTNVNNWTTVLSQGVTCPGSYIPCIVIPSPFDNIQTRGDLVQAIRANCGVIPPSFTVTKKPRRTL